ncbi:MAG TPA: hypothetical protein VMV83_12560 [Rectinemataceae bacterium]|nr:hypothetical protein [Rectinemataceae bacterium]
MFIRSCFLGLCLFGATSLLSAQTTGNGQGSPKESLPDVNLSSGGDAVLYAHLLESLLAGDFAKAEADRRALEVRWPGSPYTVKAVTMIARYGPRRDTSGIVPFYIGNLGTGTALSAIIPSSLIGVPITDQAVNGVLYLGGAAAGLGTAWLMSREGDFSLAKEIWIESLAASAAGTWFFLYDAWVPSTFDPTAPYDPAAALSIRDRVEMLGLAAALLGGRAGTWAALRDAHPSLGRAAFASQASAWSLFYSFVIMGGILEVQDPKVFSTTIVGAADAGLALGALGWDKLGWSAYRSGLVSVGGIAGFLFAAGVNMIASGIYPNLDGRVASAMMATGALGGQAVAIGLTSGMEPEAPAAASFNLQAYPSLVSGSPALGILATLRYE